MSGCSTPTGFENLMAQSVIALMVEKVRAFKGLIKGFCFTLNKSKREPRSQPGAKTNKYTCQPALSPMHFSHSQTLKETKTHLRSSHTSMCLQPEVLHAPTGLEPTAIRTIQTETHQLLAFSISIDLIGLHVT